MMKVLMATVMASSFITGCAFHNRSMDVRLDHMPGGRLGVERGVIVGRSEQDGSVEFIVAQVANRGMCVHGSPGEGGGYYSIRDASGRYGLVLSRSGNTMMMRTIDATDDNDLEGQREMDWKYFVYLSDNSIVAAALSPEGNEIASRLSLGGSPHETLREFASEGDLLDFIVSVDQDKPRNTAMATIFPAPRKEDTQ